MHLYLKDNPRGVKVLGHTEAVLVEGKQMKADMEAMGMRNVYYVPNFKNITHLPTKPPCDYHKVRFLFFSRINPFKGCNLIFEAIDILNRKGYAGRYEVGLYGMMLESYRDEFEQQIEQYKDQATYHGVIDGTDVRSHDQLAAYDVFLFPTYWGDEGFPAAIVDAFIAGLPVIASDWNCNNELIRDGENGFLIPPKDAVALAERMQWFIDHTDFIESHKIAIQQEALQFDTNHVVGKAFLKQIGMID